MPGQYIPTNYLPILVFMMIATAFALGALLMGIVMRPRRPYAEKLTPYESGNPPIGEPRARFSIKFYILAMLFVVFDVEVIFFYPWALVFDTLGLFAYLEMMVFILMLSVGYAYAWRKDALTWN